MMNISHLYESLLSKDIEININSKLENIKNANNWSDLNVNSAYEKIDFSTLRVNDIKYHASLLENISKLSVDLLLDYDHYKNFIFKVQEQFRSVDYDEKLRMLGYEIEGDYWHNIRQPSKDTVTMNVFLSCLYKNLVEIMSTVEQCTYCDTPISPGDEKCSTCGEPFGNMLISVISNKKKLSNNRINDNIERSKIDRVHLINEINITTENKKTDTVKTHKMEFLETESGKYEDTYKNMKTFHDILTNNQNKWICKSCECLNPFNVVNCQACGAHCKNNGYWICCHCSCVNEMCNDFCPACNTNNELIASANKWKCWYKNCETINKIEHNYCQECKLDRNPPDPETQLVKCYIDNKIREIWICGKCERDNPKDKFKCTNCNYFRVDTTNDWKDDKNQPENPNEIKKNPSQWECDKCTFVNNGKEKCCTICNSERNNDICQNSSSWKCWLKNCRQTNDNQYEFCQHCKLFRFSKTGEGEIVKCQDKNGIRDVWICQKCFKYNSLSNQLCGGKNCDNSRF